MAISRASPIRLAVQGARGRVGRRVCARARDDARFDLAHTISRTGAGERSAGATVACDVVIDFSAPGGTALAARFAVAQGAALLVGTTGLPDEILHQLDDAARSVAVMIAPNTALGAVVLARLVAEAAAMLGPDCTIEIGERHRAAKRDAPSGTALHLAETLRRAVGVRIGREEIRAVREGEVIGEHTVTFTAPGERLSIGHVVLDRDLFAAGALRAAAWLCRRPPGRYSIEAVVDQGPEP